MLLADYLQQWMETYKAGTVRVVTYKKYRRTLELVNELLPRATMNDDGLNRFTYQWFINTLGERYCHATITDIHRCLHACLKDALYDKMLTRDPAYGVRLGGLPAPERVKYLQPDELARLIADLDLSMAVDMGIYVAAKTGLRFAELLGLTRADFNPEAGTITVNKTLDYKRFESDGTRFTPTKNTSSVRTIRLDSATADLMREWVRTAPDDVPLFAWGGNFNETWNSRLRWHCRNACVPEVTMHVLRHTHGSVLIANGMSIQSVSRRLGHANTITTQRVYLHLLRNLEAKDNQLLEAAMAA